MKKSRGHKEANTKNRVAGFITRHNNAVGRSVVILVIAVLGFAAISAIHAATYAASSETESGTISGNAAVVSDSASSGGNAMKFGGAASTIGGCTVSGIVAPCMNGGNSGTGTSGFGTPKFDDEFNATSLDTSKWSTGWFGSGVTVAVNSSEPVCEDPTHVVEGNGELDLKATIQTSTCGGKTQPDTTGMVTSDGKYQFSYGVAESRIWVPGTGPIYEWPSWWTNGQSWPTDGEIDVMEGLGGQACAHYHVGAYPNGLGACSNGTFTGGWHTFTVNWQPGSLKFYYDGSLLWTDTNSIQAYPQYLILDMALSSKLSSPTTATECVDYVRIWQ